MSALAVAAPGRAFGPGGLRVTRTALLLVTAGALFLAGIDDTGPLPVVERHAVDSAPLALPCAVQRGAGSSVVQLLNSTDKVLPRGARLAWATTGTPAAQGQWHWVAQPLAPGQRLSIALATTLHGSGCTATLRR